MIAISFIEIIVFLEVLRHITMVINNTYYITWITTAPRYHVNIPRDNDAHNMVTIH